MSIKDPIEDLFRDNQHGYDEKPRDLIWSRIEERLDEKKAQKNKFQWWKLATAACFIFGAVLVSYFLLNEPTTENSVNGNGAISQQQEISPQEKTEILDKLEKQQPAIVSANKPQPAPEIMQEKIENPFDKHSLSTYAAPYEEYDSAMLDTKMTMKTSKESIAFDDINMNKEEVLVFRGATPEKKEKNYIKRTTILGDKSQNNNVLYEMEASAPLEQIQVQTNKHLIVYDLISKDANEIVFENTNVAYPKQIRFKKINDSVQIIYSGKDSKKKSKESKAIQAYIEENKSNILKNIGLE